MNKPHASARCDYVSYCISQVYPGNYTIKNKFYGYLTNITYFSYHISQDKPDNLTIKHKYISTQSNELLSYFNGKTKVCFGYAEALPVMRLRESIYYIIPYEQNAETFMPDWHLIAEHIVKDAEHYIGYYSALQIHNLITQPSLKEQIVVSKQLRPSEIKIKNIGFQFIYHNEKYFFGSKKIWVDSFNKVLCSNLEKTIIDCFLNQIMQVA